MQRMRSFLTLMLLCSLVLTFAPPKAHGEGWQQVAPLPTVRGALTAATGSDGRIYAVGGYGDGGTFGGPELNRVDVYNPATNVWTATAPMLFRRFLATAVGHPNGKIYVFGGADNHATAVAGECYDPATNTWTPIAQLPMESYGAAAVVASDGNIYLLAGGSEGRSQTTFAIYDPIANAWSLGPSSLTRRQRHGAAIDSLGRIFLWGGYQEAGPSAEMYDPAVGAWSALPELQNMRAEAANAMGADGRLYSAGGWSWANGRQSTIEVLSPGDPAWSYGPSLTQARNDMAGTCGRDGKIYAIGGYADVLGYVNTVEALQTSAPDSTPPVTIPVQSPSPNAAGWNNTDVTVTLSATDTQSGVAATYYRIGDGVQQQYQQPFTVSAEKLTEIEYWSVDNAGNVEVQKGPLTIRIDKTPPTITANVPAPDGSNGWYVHAPAVTFDSSDALSGLAAPVPSYVFQDGANQSYTGTATDRAGNTASATVSGINVDTLPPVTIASPNGGVSAGPVTVTLAASDAISGVAATYYKIDGGALTTYSAPFNVGGAGIHTVAFWSADVAGNVESVHTMTVSIDNKAPSIYSLTATPSAITSVAPGTIQTVTIAANITDPISGIASATYAITDSETSNVINGSLNLVGSGNYQSLVLF